MTPFCLIQHIHFGKILVTFNYVDHLNVEFFLVISNEHLYLLGLGPELVLAVGEM